MAKGPAQPIPPYKGTRYDPPEAWLFGKGYYGPPDLRPYPNSPKGWTYEFVRCAFTHLVNKDGLVTECGCFQGKPNPENMIGIT